MPANIGGFEWLGELPALVFIVLDGHTLDQLDFFRYDDSLAARSRQ